MENAPMYCEPICWENKVSYQFFHDDGCKESFGKDLILRPLHWLKEAIMEFKNFYIDKLPDDFVYDFARALTKSGGELEYSWAHLGKRSEEVDAIFSKLVAKHNVELEE